MAKQHKKYSKPNSNLIFGIHPVEEALFNRVPLQKIYFVSDNKNNAGLCKLINISRKRHVPTSFADSRKLDEIAGGRTHQGVIAVAEPYQYSTLEDVLQSCKNATSSLVVVLDHINDAGNLGAITRTAEAAGASAVIIPSKRSAQVTATTYKTSAGAVAHLPIVKVTNIANTVELLQDAGFWVAAASEHAKDDMWNENLKGKIAIVMGAEHQGVSQLVLKKCDFGLRLPMRGKIESLNVAQACSVFVYEWVRQNFNN